MIIGIDGSNLRGGGTVTHLIEILNHAHPLELGVDRVDVWSGTRTLACLPERTWLIKKYDGMLDKRLPFRVYWQRTVLPRLAGRLKYDVLFAPGGTCTGIFRPIVTMSQNMLPFQTREFLRYGLRWNAIRMALLRIAQSQSFRLADGIIFLSTYARDSVLDITGSVGGRIAVIPHGVPQAFRCPTRPQQPVQNYNNSRPFRFLYVSTVDQYKHQWHVAKAVGELHKSGLPVRLDLIGGAYSVSRKRLLRVLSQIDAASDFITYHDYVAYQDLPQWYARADVFVFASTCENQPIALLEAMAAGLPIASSAIPPMPEIAGPYAVLFDPLNPENIAAQLKRLLMDVELRTKCANDVYLRATRFSWEDASRETFEFLCEIGRARTPAVNYGEGVR